MDQVDSSNRSAARPSARPSLFASEQSTPATTSKQPEAISILSSLDKNDGKKPLKSHTGLPTWFTISIGGLFGVTIAVAIIISLTKDSGIGRHAPGMPMVIAARAAPPDKMPEAAAPAITAPSATPSSPNVVLNASAAIENAPPAAVLPAGTLSPIANIDRKPAAKSSEPVPTASQTVKTVNAGANPIPSPPNESVATSSGQTVLSERSETKTNKASTTKTKNGKVETAMATAPGDRDASLLAALVAYGEGKPATDANSRAAATSSKSSGSKSSNTPTTIAQADSHHFDPKRDVVVREPSVSTTELVRRCKTLGFVEGLLCRMRVCSNQWGKDPACPQDSMPNNTTP
jgi:hypothetical protein